MRFHWLGFDQAAFVAGKSTLLHHNDLLLNKFPEGTSVFREDYRP